MYRLARPSCRAEWDVYHRIRQDVLLESRKYDMEHPDEEEEPLHYPLLLWCGEEAIGTIRIDLLDPSTAAFRLVAIDPKCQGQGHGGKLLIAAEAFAAELVAGFVEGVEDAVGGEDDEVAGLEG